VRRYAGEELEKIREQVGDEFFYSEGRPDESRGLFEQVALGDDYAEFLTLPAYERLD
jgi:malate synthase